VIRREDLGLCDTCGLWPGRRLLCVECRPKWGVVLLLPGFPNCQYRFRLSSSMLEQKSIRSYYACGCGQESPAFRRIWWQTHRMSSDYIGRWRCQVGRGSVIGSSTWDRCSQKLAYWARQTTSSLPRWWLVCVFTWLALL